MKKNTTKKLLILKGEGIHEHVLEADMIEHPERKEGDRLSEIHVGKNGMLTHVNPVTGKPAEHNTIPMEEGTWLVGRQVEYSPFDQSITNVFD